MTTTPATQSLLPVTQDRLIYVRWSDDGQHIRKWAREPFEGATAFANAGNGAPLGPFDADDHYPAKDLPFALRSIAENIHVQCGDHVLEDMVRIVTDAASVIEASQAHSLPGDVGMREALQAIVARKPRPEFGDGEACHRCAHCAYRWPDSGDERHGPGCAYVLARAALTPSALSGDAGEGE